MDTTDIIQEDLGEQVLQRREKLANLISEGKNPYEITKFERTSSTKKIVSNFDELDQKDVVIAGRLMTRRIMGKASFFNIQDIDGNIQIYIRRDDVGEDSYNEFKKFDIGDFVGVKGFVFRTQKGEISVHCKEITLLSKALIPLPEKFHGLRDTEMRYRQRYLDLMVNENVRKTFIKRSQIIKEIRLFLDNLGFMEVETPVLNTIAGGANARPFVTHHNALDIDMFMRVAPELHLKRLIVGGFEKVYEIGRVFRNEGLSPKHNPEFTLLEIYEAYTDYRAMMDLTEKLIREVTIKVNGSGQLKYGEHDLDFDKPFEKYTMIEVVKKYSGVDFNKVSSLKEAQALAKKHNVEYEKRHLKGDIINLFFEKFCEDKLIQPTFIIGHPVEISPLAKRDPLNKDYTERFELFICGREYANAFSELNDPIDQKQRFERQAELKSLGDEEACDIDDDFVRALEYGMPPTGGLGIGIDRLIMLITNSASIRDILFFPTMKPID